MATVQQLEKLHQIQRLFYASDSLESAVAGERVAQIISRTEQLIKQRAFLRDERRRLRISTEGVEERKEALKIMRRTDWVPPSITELNTNKSKHIQINIGGLMFEAPVYILQRDAKSLLAQLCSKDPPILPDKDGFFYFDRDWWLFRYVLAFLRDGTLPDDRGVLSQLYREASYWNLTEMQKAIEEEKLHLRSVPPGKISEADAKKEKEMWWRKLPSWWLAVEEEQKKKAEDEKNKKKNADWWTDTVYNGKTFLPLSTASDKVTTAKGEKDAMVSSTVTWGARRTNEYDDVNAQDFGNAAPPPYLRSSYDRYGGTSSGGYGLSTSQSSYSFNNYNHIAPVGYMRGPAPSLAPPTYDTKTTAAPEHVKSDKI